MRKGFLHIAEVIIVAGLAFVVLSQFYSIPRSEQSWSSAKLTVMAQDLLRSLDELGTDWLDPADVNQKIGSSLANAGTLNYSLSARLTIRPFTKVLCVCNDTNYEIIRDTILTNHTGANDINGIDRVFSVSNVTLSGMDFSTNGQDLSSDVILFWDTPSLTPGQISNLSIYLSKGNGIVEYSGIKEPDFVSGWHDDILNLQWVYGSTRPAEYASDFQAFEPGEMAYEVVKIYAAFKGSVSSGFNHYGQETLYPLDDNERKILVSLDRRYSGGAFNGRLMPLAVIDWGVAGKGRSAWMSNMTLDTANKINLLKSLVSWTAGEKDMVIVDNVLSKTSRATFRKILDEDMYEPMKVELTLGYYF